MPGAIRRWVQALAVTLVTRDANRYWMSDRSDIALMRAALRDSRAFDEIYERHAVVIHLWLRGRVGEPEATDLTAETFAAAWASRNHFRAARTGHSARPWLFGIALNQYRSFLRSQRIESNARGRLGMPETYAGRFEADDANDRVLAAQAAAELERALEQLSPEQRHAVELRVVGELSFADVASSMASSEPTARTRVMRGLRSLRSVMGDGRARP
jgi:RNA polymerase sigma factor (sigma-70 family)